MRAVVLPGANQPLEFRADHPAAGTGREGGEIIDVTACGVCHSDIHVVDGDFPSPLPMVLGHEVTGVHPEMGPVMVYAPWGCGNCQQCTDGEEMICANATEAGLFTDGGYSEQMWIKDRFYLAPLDGLDPQTGPAHRRQRTSPGLEGVGVVEVRGVVTGSSGMCRALLGVMQRDFAVAERCVGS